MTHRTLLLFACFVLVGAVHCGASGDETSSPPPGPVAASVTPASIVERRRCGSCHDGSSGRLAGSDAPIAGTQVWAPNLTPDPDTGVGRWSDDQLAHALRDGVDDGGDPLCAVMPRLPDASDDELRALIVELRAVPPVVHRVPDGTCD